MVSKLPVDVFDAASDAWQTAMGQKNFDEAVKAGIHAYLHYRAEDNQKLSMGALNLIHLAIGRPIFGNNTLTSRLCCSFCGRSGLDVRLGAGPDAVICADCVGIFYEELVTKKADQNEIERATPTEDV